MRIVRNSYYDDILSTTLVSVLQKVNLQVYIADNVSVTALKNQLQNLFLQVYLQVWDKARADRENLIEAVHYAFLIMIELHT